MEFYTSQSLKWPNPPQKILVIQKIHDPSVGPAFVELIKWLLVEKKMTIVVESNVLKDSRLELGPLFTQFKEKLITIDSDEDVGRDDLDLIICLGGDGTLLYASSLFQRKVPPVMAFHMGSLGFLAPFEFDTFCNEVTKVLEGEAVLTVRSRLYCSVRKKNQKEPQSHHLILNEVVLDRGLSPFLSNLDLYIENKYITTVQGDGLIVSTPTGSTAYAVAAGASMVHPSVPAVMITPICPHSLSFRPIVVPSGIELKIKVSLDSRNSAWVSFDGRKRQELEPGDELRVTTSIHPVPSICFTDPIGDWFDSLGECLHWNDRKRQRKFNSFTSHNHSHDVF